jgi:hypothetical protein
MEPHSDFGVRFANQLQLAIGNDAKTPGVAIAIPFRVVDAVVRGPSAAITDR